MSTDRKRRVYCETGYEKQARDNTEAWVLDTV